MFVCVCVLMFIVFMCVFLRACAYECYLENKK